MSSPPLTVRINGHEVTDAIRSLEVTANVSRIAAQQAVRQALVEQQQRYGEQGGIVVEGRDIGTHVFPDAELKIFLTASVQERALRRYRELQGQGQSEISLQHIEEAIAERDRLDSSRELAPLRPAWDAIELSTDGLSVADVIAKMTELYEKILSKPVYS